MSMAVLMSIHPEWVEKIASGEKTVEVRKTAARHYISMETSTVQQVSGRRTRYETHRRGRATEV